MTHGPAVDNRWKEAAAPIRGDTQAVAARVEHELLRSRIYAAGLYLMVVGLFIAGYLGVEPYDDAYFFKRVALNLLEHGSWSWNVDEGPVYGNTSQGMQALALIVTAVVPEHYVLCMRILLGLALVVGLWFSIRATEPRGSALATMYAFCSPPLLFASTSGMETAFAISGLSVFLAWLLRPWQTGSSRWPGPALVVLIYLFRPDAALLAAPALLLVRAWRTRSLPLFEGLAIAVGVGGALFAFWICYGTPLPLAFYAKQAAFTPYTERFVEASLEAKKLHLGVFLVTALPLALVALRLRDALNLILLASVCAFVGFHAVTTIEIMGMHARFYAPALPLLAVGAARGARWVSPRSPLTHVSLGLYAIVALTLWREGWLPTDADWILERLPRETYAWLGVCGAVLLSGVLRSRPAWLLSCLLAGSTAVVVAKTASFATHFGVRDEDYLHTHIRHSTTSRGLEELVACFGDALHIYHSDIGVAGLMVRKGKVTDVAGLFNEEWLFGSRSGVDARCLRDSPEGIFLPAQNYPALAQQFRDGKCLARYQRVVRRSVSPLYLRKDLVPRFRACEAARGGGA